MQRVESYWDPVESDQASAQEFRENLEREEESALVVNLGW